MGGGIFVCSNTDCSSKLVIVNTIIAGNTGGLVDGAYFVPTDLGYWKGDKKDGVEIVRNYDWELKNCIFGATYSTSDDTQLNNVDPVSYTHLDISLIVITFWITMTR